MVSATMTRRILWAFALASSVPVMAESGLVVGEWTQVAAGAEQGDHLYRFAVTQGDYVRGRIEGDDVVLTLDNGSLPSRTLADTARNIRDFQFVADVAGMLLLRVRQKERAGFRLTLSDRVALAAQKAPERMPDSPRLRRLSALLQQGGSTDAFWADMARAGTPMVEPVDDDTALVTFLWRGAKRNVRLFGAPSGDHDPLERLGVSDLWYKSYRLPRTTRLSYQFAPDVPELDRPAMERRLAIRSVTQADPFNPHRFPASEADRFAADSVLELDGAPPQPWAVPNPAAPAGTITRYSLASEALGNSRSIHIYRSAGYRAGVADAPLLILFDAEEYLARVPTPAILDNLVATGAIPPLAAILIGNPSRAARAAELPCNPVFLNFLVRDVLRLAAGLGVSANARHTIIGGSSYGGLAATCAALSHPDRFGNVLSLSGSYWWSPGTAEEPEWVARHYAAQPTQPVRFYLDAGLFEVGPGQQGILETNRHLRDVLKAKGYSVRYAEHAGGHDYLAWRGSLAEGLTHLLAK